MFIMIKIPEWSFNILWAFMWLGIQIARPILWILKKILFVWDKYKGR